MRRRKNCKTAQRVADSDAGRGALRIDPAAAMPAVGDDAGIGLDCLQDFRGLVIEQRELVISRVKRKPAVLGLDGAQGGVPFELDEGAGMTRFPPDVQL